MNASQPQLPSTGKPRNPVERILVRGGIVLLVGLVFIEYRAKQGYDASIQGLQELTDRNQDATIQEAQLQLVGYSTYNGPVADNQGLDTYNYRWFSLFKSGTYQLTLTAASDRKTLQTFGGPAFAEDPDVVAARMAESNADFPGDAPPIIGAAPGTGGPVAAKESAAENNQSLEGAGSESAKQDGQANDDLPDTDATNQIP